MNAMKQAFVRENGVIIDMLGHDGPTREQMRKFKPERIKTGEIDSEQGVSLAYKVTEGSSLARLTKRGVLTELQCRAGEAYFATWYLSGIDQNITADYGRSIGKGEATYGMPPSEAAAHHRRNLREARNAIGIKSWRMVENVIVYDWSLRDVGWDTRKGKGSYRQSIRDGKASVIAGLDALVDFYQIS